MRRMLMRTSAVALASATQVAVLALLSLCVARYLSVEEFGVVRVITSYMVALALIGSLCVHDAAASSMARAADLDSRRRIVAGATIVAGLSSVTLTLVIEAVVHLTGFWQGGMRRTLAIIALCLPLAALTQVYSSLMQAVGAYRSLTVYLILVGLVPLLLIVPATLWANLDGWILGRVVAYAVLLAIAVPFMREAFSGWRRLSGVVQEMREIARHGSMQLVSATLSMVLLSGDVVLLERLTGNLHLVALYGMAALFARSAAILPTAIGRVFFRQIAQQDAGSARAARRLLISVAAASGALAALMALVVPGTLRYLYGAAYEAAIPVLNAMLVGLIFQSCWSALSTINVAMKRPRASVMVSLAGVVTAVVLLPVLIHSSGAIGAAWAMNAAYAACTCVGLYLHSRARRVPVSLPSAQGDGLSQLAERS